MEIDELIKWLEEELWYPEKPTGHQMDVAHHLNTIINDMILRLKKKKYENTLL